jgi:glycosyltransferase involved in cell wall biosynthesis
MKVLTFAHRLEVGGTQVNAIEIAAGLRDLHGHDVTIFATSGPMARLVEQKGLRFVPAPDAYLHPSLPRMRALRQLVRTERPDVIHAWDWWQVLDACYSVHWPMQVPMVVSDMMMDLTRILPKSLPTTFGTPLLVEEARARGRHRAELMVPPVDVKLNAPDAADGPAFRARYGLGPEEVAIVSVSRLSEHMKSESLFHAIEAMRRLAKSQPLRLVIVGEGGARPALEAAARSVNEFLGRPAVLFTGALLDPRAAYAAADVVIGMGGSSLRALAFGKPLVVLGERGYAELFTPKSAEWFFRNGMFGRGVGAEDSDRLHDALARITGPEADRQSLGSFGRRFVVDRFSLESVCASLSRLLEDAVVRPQSFGTSLADAARTTAVYLRERRFLTPSRDRKPREATVD